MYDLVAASNISGWAFNKECYYRNFIVAYFLVMTKVVPIVSIISSVIGVVICVQLFKELFCTSITYTKAINKDAWNVLLAFTTMTMIGQLNTMLASSLFLFHWKQLVLKNTTFNVIEARISGTIYIWTRLANSCLILIMMLYALSERHFVLWKSVVIYCIVAPLCLSVYALVADLTGFNYSQLVINSCGIKMSPIPKNDTFELETIWNYAIEVTDFFIFVFCAYSVMREFIKHPERIRLLPVSRRLLIQDQSGLLILIPCVMMCSKAFEILRILICSWFFCQLDYDQARYIGTASLVLMILQALFECGQPLLTLMTIRVYMEERTNWLFCLRKRDDEFQNLINVIHNESVPI